MKERITAYQWLMVFILVPAFVFGTFAITLSMAGCATKATTLPPGALNQFDLTSYESLMGAQAVIESVKTDIANLPPSAKGPLNRAIESYNIAESAWQSYHSGVSKDQVGLTAAIAQLTTNVAVLISSFTGAK